MTRDIQNLNNLYYKTLDENFNQALTFFEKDTPLEKLFEMLKNGNIVQKQISALKINNISNKNQAKILTDNLTGQDGKIREAVSLKIYELINENPEISKYFYEESIYNTFLDAIIDVNANVCRNIIAALKLLQNNEEFCLYFSKKLVQITQNYIDIVKKTDFKDGKYKINKEVFKLYWCLEAIYEFVNYIESDSLKGILLQTKNINEYTIREKTAKILTKIHDDRELLKIRAELKKDKNYYVRRF